MQNTPHLNPLPSTEGRGEAWIFREAHARRQHAIIVIIISILAMAARLILINQPYVDHWSWRQSDVAAISRFFCKTDFVSAIRKLRAGRRQRRRLQLAFFAVITLPPPAIWYWHAHQIAQEFYLIISSAPAGLESNLSGGTGRLHNKIWYPVSRRLFQR
jgi:hypothetical protein